MKVCATCKKTFADEVAYCPTDRTYLQKVLPAGEAAAGSDDEDWLRSKLAAGAQAIDFQQPDEPTPIELTPMMSAPPAIALEAVAPTAQAQNPDLMSALDDHAAPPAPSRTTGSMAAAATPAKHRSSEELEKLLTPTRTSAPSIPRAGSSSSPQALTATGAPIPEPAMKRRAAPTAAPVPWDKIGIAIAAVIVIIGVLYFFKGRSSPTGGAEADSTASTSTATPSSTDDVDVELALRDKLAQGRDFVGEKIEIRVKDGKIVLSGEISSAGKAEAAQRYAAEVAAGRQVVNKMTVRGNVNYMPSETKAHTAISGSLDREDFGDAGVAQQMNANDLVAAGDKALAAGNKQQAAGYFRKALDKNPNDTAARDGYTKATTVQ